MLWHAENTHTANRVSVAAESRRRVTSNRRFDSITIFTCKQIRHSAIYLSVCTQRRTKRMSDILILFVIYYAHVVGMRVVS